MASPAPQASGSSIEQAANAVPAASRAEPKGPTRIKPCRYHGTKTGCKAGAACPFRHEATPSHASPVTGHDHASSASPNPAADAAPPPPQRRYQAPAVADTRAVARPVPAKQLDDPREFQLRQLRRRFSPAESTDGDDALFAFKLRPSDPDFPYEIEALLCTLRIPHGYPDSGRPRLRVSNKEIVRGFQLNIERGFDEIAAAAPNATLLGLTNRLDKALEELLSRPMAETIKLVVNAKPKPAETPQVPLPAQVKAPVTSARSPSPPAFTQAQRDAAAAKRHGDVRQLVARLGKSPGFTQGGDGVSFALPHTVFRSPVAPQGIKSASSLQLIVPELFNLSPCRIRFGGSRTDVMANVEAAFLERAGSQIDSTLLAHVNHLSLNLKSMAVPRTKQVVEKTEVTPLLVEPLVKATEDAPKDTPVPTEKPHVQVIPRPLEWSRDQPEDGDSSDDSTGSETDEASDAEAPAEVDEKPHAFVKTAEKGLLLSFPNIELYGIELLELTSLSLTVKCDRCKELKDFEKLKNNASGDHTGMKEEGCKKCSSSLAAGYRMDMIHINSSRAGYVDLDGCTAVDMLPSTFVPTCSECSTAYSTGCVSVRGDSTLAVCRECHRKMSFKLVETKFLMMSAAAERATQGPARKKTRENLGIVAGQELPRKGKCQHYAKSYRWFRFSCCQKVFPCDRCHDLANPDHVHEFANRMICGYCSREQNYRPEDCGVCHSALVGRKGSGFWEGGKGTRDKARMSRKDPRKYKRRPGTVVGGGGGKK